MKKTINFYSEEQLETLKAEVLSQRRPCDIIKEYSAKWNRPLPGMSLKVNQLRKDLNLSKTANKKVTPASSPKKLGRPRKDAVVEKPQTATVENGVSLPSGFVFDFKPHRAEMHSDHVRLYF
jgi:hypothetical protein